MCQAAPGPRCYNDSSRKLSQLKNRVIKLKDENTKLELAISSAQAANNSSEVKKLTDRKSMLTSKVTGLETEIRHVQRDVDGTLTGRRHLQDELETARDPKAIREIEIRLRAGAALRHARETALDWASSNRPAPIRLVSKAA